MPIFCHYLQQKGTFIITGKVAIARDERLVNIDQTQIKDMFEKVSDFVQLSHSAYTESDLRTNPLPDGFLEPD
jgi:hypothetical protein